MPGAAAEEARGSRSPRGRRGLAWGLLLVCVILGLLVAAHMRAQQGLGAELQSQSLDELGALVGALSRDVGRLQEEAAELRIQLADQEARLGSDAILTSQEEDNLEALELITGRVKGQGPGIVLEISDELGALTPFELEQVVGELRSSGAEAIVLNGTRLEFNAHFGGVPPHLTVSGQELRQPYIMQAVGPAAALASALELPGGLLSSLRALPGVKAPLYTEDLIIVPARSRLDVVFEHATRAQN